MTAFAVARGGHPSGFLPVTPFRGTPSTLSKSYMRRNTNGTEQVHETLVVFAYL